MTIKIKQCQIRKQIVSNDGVIMKYLRYFIVLFVIAIVIVFLMINAYTDAKNDALNQLYNQEKLLAQQAANGIKEYFNYHKQMMSFLSSNDDVILNTEAGKKLIREVFKNQSNSISSLTRVDKNGIIVYTFPDERSIGRDISGQKHVKEILKNQSIVVSDVFRSVQGFDCIAIHYPIFNKNEFDGTLALLIPFDLITKKYFEQIRVGNTGYPLVITSEGTELFCPVPNHTGTNIFKSSAKYPSIIEMAKLMVQGKEGRFVYDFDMIRDRQVNLVTKHAYFVPIQIENSLWSIAISAPEEEATYLIKGFRNKWIFGLGAFLTFVGLLSFLLIKAYFDNKKILVEEEAKVQINIAEEERRKALQLLDISIHQSPAGIIVIDANTEKIIICNRAALEINQLHYDNVINKDFVEFVRDWRVFDPKDLSPLNLDEFPIMKAIKSGKSTHNAEIVIKTKYDLNKWLLVNASPITNNSGDIISAIVVFYDITERKIAEEAVKNSEEKFRTLVNSTSDAIFILKDGIFSEINPSTEKLFGATKEEIIGKTPSDFSPEFQSDGMRSIEKANLLVNTALTDKAQFFEWMHKTKSGYEFLAEVSLTKMELGENQLIAIVRDITDRKKAEEQRKELEEQLIQAQKIESLGRLAGGIAHDFNNMLTPIMGYSEILMAEMPDTDPRRNRLQQIVKSVISTRELVKQLLAFARKQTLEIRQFNMNDILNEFYTIITRTIRENIKIKFVLKPNLKLIEADQGQIEQIIMNLCLNAQDAMPNGGTLTVETDNVYLDEHYAKQHKGCMQGNYVMLSISDSGHGMDKETQKMIFEPFFTTKGLGRGTGLGLATVHGIVKQHGGHIWLYSDLGQGTVFKIFFPIADKLEIEPVIVNQNVNDLHGHEMILVVEDEEQVREMTVELIKSFGYEVIDASCGTEAIELAHKNQDRINLVLSDVILPDLNGKELFAEIKTIAKGARVIFMSGYTADVISQHKVSDQSINFIQKPFSMQSLMLKIREVLDN